ncbi:MAG: hypothetical protein Q9218_007142 [Villophora microphyllina]
MSSGVSISDVLSLIELTTETHCGWQAACTEFTKIASQLRSLGVVLSGLDVGARNPFDLRGNHLDGVHSFRELVGSCKTLVSKLNDIIAVISSNQLEQHRRALDLHIRRLADRSPLDKDLLGKEDTARFSPAAEWEDSDGSPFPDGNRGTLSDTESEQAPTPASRERSYENQHHRRQSAFSDQDYVVSHDDEPGAFDAAPNPPPPQPWIDPESSNRRPRQRANSEAGYKRNKGRPHQALLGYAALPKKDNYTLAKCPILPREMGWSCRTDEQNRPFYVDDLACQGHKTCFWRPPIPEKHPKKPLPAGWVRVETLFGRVFWRHKSGLVSHEHPYRTSDIRYSPDGIQFKVKVQGSYSYQPWRSVHTKNLILDDVDIACQMTGEAWERGWRWWSDAKPKLAKDGTIQYNYL